jgi:hypothetical protein
MLFRHEEPGIGSHFFSLGVKLDKMRFHSCMVCFGEGVPNDGTSVVLFNAIQNFDL